MDTITVDFETYYDRDYSLSKMQTDAYILDDRYETILVTVITPDNQEHWFSGDELETAGWLRQFPWEECAVRCHNTLFDGFIQTQRFGIKPKLWKDTLGQLRMLRPYLPSHSLASMAKLFGLEDKGTEVQAALGKRRADFSREELLAYAGYGMKDTRICKAAGEYMDQFTPPLAVKLIDMTIRMFTEPMLVGDKAAMQSLYEDEVVRKQRLLEAAEVDREIIMSNNKFAARLEELGVVPPKKISKTTGKETFAFSKTDKEFTDLQEHDLPEVQALVAARLGTKTTIAETRAARFIEMASRGPLPVALSFWGAKTTGRYSGTNQVNWQNLPARGPSAGLRNTLMAPPGYVVLVGDSSNIELRTVMALAGQDDVVDKLRSGTDLYCDFASRMFGRPITKADKPERQLGKVAMLSLQYGAGAARFQEMVRVASQTDKSLQPITLDRAHEIVDLYRSVHWKVVELWRRCDKVVLPDIAAGCSLMHVDVNGWFITQNDGFGRPGEPGVMYHDLKHDGNEWTYQMGRGRVGIHGAKVVENLSQHAAMQIVMWQTARINERFPVKLSVHDEAVCVVREEELDEARAYMEECLSMAPKWCRGVIPVACETGAGESYGSAKS